MVNGIKDLHKLYKLDIEDLQNNVCQKFGICKVLLLGNYIDDIYLLDSYLSNLASDILEDIALFITKYIEINKKFWRYPAKIEDVINVKNKSLKSAVRRLYKKLYHNYFMWILKFNELKHFDFEHKNDINKIFNIYKPFIATQKTLKQYIEDIQSFIYETHILLLNEVIKQNGDFAFDKMNKKIRKPDDYLKYWKEQIPEYHSYVLLYYSQWQNIYLNDTIALNKSNKFFNKFNKTEIKNMLKQDFLDFYDRIIDLLSKLESYSKIINKSI